MPKFDEHLLRQELGSQSKDELIDRIVDDQRFFAGVGSISSSSLGFARRLFLGPGLDDAGARWVDGLVIFARRRTPGRFPVRETAELLVALLARLTRQRILILIILLAPVLTAVLQLVLMDNQNSLQTRQLVQEAFLTTTQIREVLDRPPLNEAGRSVERYHEKLGSAVAYSGADGIHHWPSPNPSQLQTLRQFYREDPELFRLAIEPLLGDDHQGVRGAAALVWSELKLTFQEPVTLQRVSWSALHLGEVHLPTGTFDRLNLDGTRIGKLEWSDAEIRWLYAPRARINGSVWTDSKLHAAYLVGSEFRNTTWKHVKIDKACARDVTLEFAELDAVQITDSDLAYSTISVSNPTPHPHNPAVIGVDMSGTNIFAIDATPELARQLQSAGAICTDPATDTKYSQSDCPVGDLAAPHRDAPAELSQECSQLQQYWTWKLAPVR